MLSNNSYVSVVRPCGKFMPVPIGAKPPPTVICGNPEFAGLLVARTTPGSGLPASSVKIVDASRPESWVVRFSEFNEYPKRSSFRNDRVNVCDSFIITDRCRKGPRFPPVSGVGPAAKLLPQYPVQRPES